MICLFCLHVKGHTVRTNQGFFLLHNQANVSMVGKGVDGKKTKDKDVKETKAK